MRTLMDFLSLNLMVLELLLNNKLGRSVLNRQSTQYDPFILILQAGCRDRFNVPPPPGPNLNTLEKGNKRTVPPFPEFNKSPAEIFNSTERS